MNMKNVKILFLFFLFFGFFSTQAQEKLTLNQVIERTKANNKSLKISENEIRIAEDKNKEVKNNLLPKIKASGDYKYFFDLPTQLMPAKAFNPQAPDWQFKPAQFGVPHNINANIQLVVPLFNPELYTNIKTTKIAKELSELKYKKTQRDILYNVSKIYYNAQLIKSQLKFLDKNISNTKKLLDNLKLLKSQGLVKGSDVNKMDLQLSQLHTQYEQAQANYEKTLDILKFYMGMPLNNKIDINTDVIVDDDKYDYNQDNNIDYQLLKKKSSLISNQIKSLKRSRLPKLSMYASYGTTGYGYDEKPHDFLDFYDVSFVGAKLNIPIFNGTTTTRKIKQKKYELENNNYQLELVADQKQMEIKNANLNLAVNKKKISDTDYQIKLAQKVYDQSILEQKQGVAGLTDVLMADNNLRMAQQNYLQAQIDYLKTKLELKKLTGKLK